MTVDPGPERVFVGRAETAETLHRRFEDARGGAGGVTLLVGDTGVGKSTLISELVRDIRRRGVRLLIGRALPLDDPPPYSLLQSAIESAHDDPALRSDEDPALGGGQMLIGFVPRLGERDLPAPVGIEGRLLDLLGGSAGQSTISRDRVLTNIAERFLEFTRHGPTVVVLDDLHRGDESSLSAVEFFVNELKDRPLWILAATRPYGSLSRTGRARLEQFERATRAERIALPPMTSAEATAFLKASDPYRELSSEDVARRFSETGGNPLLLQQFARRSSTDDDAEGRPGTPRARLDEEAQQTLDLAAVLGPEFTFDLLLRASGVDEERLTEIIDRLVGRGLLLEHQGEILAFPDDRLREEAYVRLAENRRRQLHRRAGGALEAMGSPDISRAYALARHFYLGRDGKRSVQYNQIAAQLAEQALAPDAAWDHFSRALESHRELIPEDPDGESELVLDLARVTEELGLLKDSEGILKEFLDREKDNPGLSSSRRATLELFLARVLIAEGDGPAAAELAQKVLVTPGLEGERLVRIGAHRQAGIVLYYAGNYREALDHHTEEIRLAREFGNELVLARAQVWRVAALQMIGQTQQAISEAREATATRDRFGSARESAMAHLFLGDILADSRSTPPQREEALAVYGEAIRFAETAKDPRRIAWALYKTAELLCERKRFDEATEKVGRACELFDRIGDQVGMSVSMKVRGQIAMGQGNYDLAEADLLGAHRLLRGLNHTLEEIDVVLRLGQLSLARGNTADALGRVAELERQNLPAARADLLPEFERLKRELPSKSDGGGEPS
ncbi:MAG TPA: AAA family ATPase [Thermoplasmata archaeon]|nr:AAA family ATPase [Thermoplasmata archaeon]